MLGIPKADKLVKNTRRRVVIEWGWPELDAHRLGRNATTVDIKLHILRENINRMPLSHEDLPRITVEEVDEPGR